MCSPKFFCVVVVGVGVLFSVTTDAFQSTNVRRWKTLQITQRPFLSTISRSATKISSNVDLLPGIASIDAQNHEFYEHLLVLREKPSFRLYSVDMLASCEYMPQELFECYSQTCEIYPVDEDEVSE